MLSRRYAGSLSDFWVTSNALICVLGIAVSIRWGWRAIDLYTGFTLKRVLQFILGGACPLICTYYTVAHMITLGCCTMYIKSCLSDYIDKRGDRYDDTDVVEVVDRYNKAKKMLEECSRDFGVVTIIVFLMAIMHVAVYYQMIQTASEDSWGWEGVIQGTIMLLIWLTFLGFPSLEIDKARVKSAPGQQTVWTMMTTDISRDEDVRRKMSPLYIQQMQNFTMVGSLLEHEQPGWTAAGGVVFTMSTIKACANFVYVFFTYTVFTKTG